MSGLPPRRVLMTVDAVGGVWRYAMDLAAALAPLGTRTVFACLGPAPSKDKEDEARGIGEFIAVDAPLDWLAKDASELDAVPQRLAELAAKLGADLLHLNVPSQAAGLRTKLPVVVVSHSCVTTWFAGVRGTELPEDWQWQKELNLAGFAAADIAVAPSQSHATLLSECYGDLGDLRVVPNAVRPLAAAPERKAFVIAAGRWWDEGKNGKTLDLAAAQCKWPIHMAGPTRGPAGELVTIESATPLGEVPAEKVRELMARAGAFVSPSLYEPFGLAALEAASCGLPLVLADIPTYRELWDGAALFARRDDAEGYALILNQLADNQALRAEFGARAQERSQQFTASRQAKAMADIYAAAIARTLPNFARARA